MPSAPFVVPPLLLAGILVVSGVAKVRTVEDTTSVFAKLRLPPWLVRVRGPQILPYAELVLAALLVLLPGGWYVVATTPTLVLFVAYEIVVVRALRFPYKVRCGCFGRLGLGWITPQTAIRNAVLVLLALVTWLDSFRSDGVLTRLGHLGRDGWWLAAVLVTLVTTALVVRDSRMPEPERGPAVDPDEYVGRPIPYALVDGPGGPSSVWKLSDVAARLLVFWDPRSDDAYTVATRLPVWKERLSPVVVHLVSWTEWSTVRNLWPEIAQDLLGDPDNQTRLGLQVWTHPGAVLLGTDRLLAGGPALGLEEIEELVEAAAEELRAAFATDDTRQPEQQPAQ